MAIHRTRHYSSIRPTQILHQLQYSKYENISDHFRIIYKTENDKIYCNPSQWVLNLDELAIGTKPG